MPPRLSVRFSVKECSVSLQVRHRRGPRTSPISDFFSACVAQPAVITKSDASLPSFRSANTAGTPVLHEQDQVHCEYEHSGGNARQNAACPLLRRSGVFSSRTGTFLLPVVDL